MKFQKQQARSEFGRAWVPAAQRHSGAAAAQAGGSSELAAAGKAVASFYASLVGSTGSGWVSGGTLQDAEKAGRNGGVAMVAATPAAAAAAGQAAPAESLHAGLGSAAARAELAAEAAALQYAQPAGPLPLGEQQHQQHEREQQQAVVQPPASISQQQQEAAVRAPREGVRYGIARSNVGYRLLKKAGWREGAGLGAQEQGMAEPVAPFQQKGNLGLGFAPKQPPKGKPGERPAAGGSALGQAGGSGGGGGAGVAAQGQWPKRALPDDPLDKEDQETKVKRVRQVMQADADAKAGKAIERYMRMAFNDATGEPTADSNPLLRRNHKLSASNPLL